MNQFFYQVLAVCARVQYASLKTKNVFPWKKFYFIEPTNRSYKVSCRWGLTKSERQERALWKPNRGWRWKGWKRVGICKMFTNFSGTSFKIMNILWTSYKLLMNFKSASYKYLKNFLRTSRVLLTNTLQTSYKLLRNFLQTFYKLFTIFLQSFYNLFTNFLQISYKRLTNIL